MTSSAHKNSAQGWPRAILAVLAAVSLVLGVTPVAYAVDEDAASSASASAKERAAKSANTADTDSVTDSSGSESEDLGSTMNGNTLEEPAPAAPDNSVDTDAPAEQQSVPTVEAVSPSAEESSSEESKPSEESTPSEEPREMQMRSTSPSFKGDWRPNPLPAANPPMPQKCGLNIALVFDLSKSVDSTELSQMKSAAKSTIDGLVGTSTSVGLFNFANNSPAYGNSEDTQQPVALSLIDSDPNSGNAQTLKDKIDSMTVPFLFAATNWEAGLRAVKDASTHYDVVYFITDGTPTKHNGGPEHPETYQADVNKAVEAANELKGAGTRIVPIGVNIADDQVTFGAWPNQKYSYPSDMMKFISDNDAPELLDDFGVLASSLVDIAASSCSGAITIKKEIVDAAGNVVIGPKEGWQFKAVASGALIDANDHVVGELSQDTDAEGSTRFRVQSETDVSVTETQKDGYTLHRQGEDNDTCVDTTGDDMFVSNDGNHGFKVRIPKRPNSQQLGSVTCTVQNKEIKPSIKKEAAGGGAHGAPVQVKPDNTAELTYTVTMFNDSEGTVSGQPVDIIQLPTGVVANGAAKITTHNPADGVTVTGAKENIPQADLVKGKEVPLADSVKLEPGKSQTFEIKIPIKVIDNYPSTWENLTICEGDGGVVSQKGVPNSVKPFAGDNPADNNACIPLQQAKGATVTINKIDRNGENSPLSGAQFRLYESSLSGDILWDKPVTSDPIVGNDATGTDIKAGKYFLVETKAPEGYTLLSVPVPVEIVGYQNGYKLKLSESDTGLVTVTPNADVDEEQPADAVTIQVADVHAAETLPKTGGIGVGVISLIGLLLVGAGAWFARRQTS